MSANELIARLMPHSINHGGACLAYFNKIRGIPARYHAISMKPLVILRVRFAGTEAFEHSRRERKKIEMRFAHLKRILRLGRLRLRGPRGAQDEFVLAAIAQNLRRLAALVTRPQPAEVQCIA